MLSSSSKLIVFAIFVCYVVYVSGRVQKYKVNESLETKYVRKFGNGKPVKWDALAIMSPEQRAEVCKSVHEKTGFGQLKDADLKETSTQDAYLTFSNPKFKKTFTQVLSCKKNNKEQYVYHLTKALDKDSVMLVYPVKDVKFNEKDVFAFTKRDQIPNIPILKKIGK